MIIIESRETIEPDSAGTQQHSWQSHARARHQVGRFRHDTLPILYTELSIQRVQIATTHSRVCTLYHLIHSFRLACCADRVCQQHYQLEFVGFEARGRDIACSLTWTV